MTLPSTRAIIYKDPGSCTSWGPRGMDAWYCGPAMDHYHNCHFYVPETHAYQISASFNLFAQHCALQDLNAEQHAKVIGNELIDSIQALPTITKTTFISTIHEAIENLANNKPIQVTNKGTKLTAQDNPNLDEALPACWTQSQTQLANNNTIYITNKNAQYKIPTPTTSEGESQIQRVSTAPPVPTSTNPTAPCTLQNKPCTHQQQTRNNTPGAIPSILMENLPQKTHSPNSNQIPYLSPHIISQEAVNYITNRVYYEDPPTQWAPWAFISSNPTNSGNNMDIDIEHFCAPIIHPITRKTISNYKN